MARYVKCFRDFSGGLSSAAGDNMADNQLQQAQNLVPGVSCGLLRADGTEQALPPLPEQDSHRLAELRELTLANGSTQLIAFSEYGEGRQNVYRFNSLQQSWVSLVSAAAPKKDSFIRAHKLYWLTGDDVKVYDGVAVTSLAATPAGDSLSPAESAVWDKVKQAVAVEQRGRRWFYATADNEVIFSEIGDPARVEPTSIVNVDPGGNDHITALKEFCGGLLIFLTGSVYFLAGWDLEGGSDVTLSRLNVTSGTAFPRTVQVAENAAFYLGRDGVYRLHLPANGTVLAAANISENRVGRDLLSGSSATDAWAVVWNNVYHISVSYAEGGPLEYRYYPGLNAFFGPYDHRAWSYSLLGAGDLLLGLNNGRIARFDPASRRYLLDNGAYGPIRVYAVTKGFDIAGAIARGVKVKSVILAARQFLAESSHATVRLKTDYTDAQFRLDLLSMDESLIYGEGAFGEAVLGWKDLVTKELLINRRAKRVTLFISDDHPDEPLAIYGAAVCYKPRKVRGERDGSRIAVDYED